MIAAPNYLLEQSICNYLTSASFTAGSLLSGSNYTCYTGIGNIDKSVPSVTLFNATDGNNYTRYNGIGNIDTIPTRSVIIDVGDVREIAPFTQNYIFNVNVLVKEAINTNPTASLAGGIFNEFVDSNSASTNFTNTSSYHIRIWQVITDGMITATSSGSLVNQFKAKLVGATV